ncbi:universal stress protein [Daejeonella oryzae]|uniref:universal stress protein n=1 Tax=Daejeonella oryzae TaxID=1122943 RepID=UPI00041A4BE1|nr:universal stress protein [Daejeonella oryzae]
MGKILVTTDFSSNSKAGIRFAIQLASQAGHELVFYYAAEILKPTSWSPERYKNYAASEIARHQKKLEQFIAVICKKSNLSPVKYTCVVQIAVEFGSYVVSYAEKIKADFICISTRGAGKIEKLFGTNASTLIATSSVPVIVVPYTYRVKSINNIWYASDLQNFELEIKSVGKFASALKAKIKVLHYEILLHLKENKDKFAELESKYSSEVIHFQFKKLDIEYPLTYHIQRDIKKAKPSLLILFTKQDRSWFDRFFLSSDAAEIAFDSKTPMLVYRKNKLK